MEAKLKEKKWTKELEQPIFDKWKKEKPYKFKKKTRSKIYSIDTPPPYVNMPVHIGQATTYVLMDMFARYHRMKGEEVLFPLGLDKNGLPIEIATEKKFNVKLTDTPRQKFIDLCKKLLDEAGSVSVESFLRLGISFNSFELGKEIGDVYETDSEIYRAVTQSTFIDLWKRGLIYEDERVSNWDPELQTTVADSEIDYKDISSFFNDIKFKIKETGEEIIIGTTRPELICSCGAVIFNPKDKRYKHLEGKTVLTPFYKKEIPLFAHPQAQMDKGTGLVMMCSAGDLSDIRFFREQKLKPIISINKDGTMNSNAGFLKGLKVKEARKTIALKLKDEGLLVNSVRTSHRTPVSERSGAEIEFISTKELYLKQIEYKGKMKEIAQKIKFYSPDSRKILLDWIEMVSIDWPISRSRYYATEIPLWYCSCGEVIVPKKGKYYQPWKEKAPVKVCPKCKGKKFRGEERVFDTWFDSSISALYVLMYERDDKFFKKAYPCTLRPSGKEIVRTWGYYAILRAQQLTKKAVFRDYWVNYHVLDEKGYKMSKSKNNVINPKEILDKYGAEPFRLWAAIEGNLTRTDFRCSLERIEGATKTVTKLWNVARFISIFPEAKKGKKILALDQWILNELHKIVKLCDKHYSEYDFHTPGTKLKHFIWETFSSHYLELVKARLYNQDNKFTKEEQNSGLYTVHHCLDILLKLLAPINPLITSSIYKQLKGKDIHFEAFPKAEKTKKGKFTTEELVALNSFIWKHKKDKQLSLKAEIKKLVLEKKFKSIEKDIIAAHHPQTVTYAKGLYIEA